MIRGGHLLGPPGVHHLRRAPLWVQVTCGCCGIGFEANAYTVPQYRDAPACRSCWRRLNLFRRQANLDEWDTPEDAYPGADPDQVRDEIPTVAHPRVRLPRFVPPDPPAA
jgi:hypothetical protein